MITDKFSNRAFAMPFLIGINTVLWIALWVNFGLNSTYLQDAHGQPDDSYTVLIVFHRAASPFIFSSHNWSYYGDFLANFPSYVFTHLAFSLILRQPRSPELYLGTTVAGYEVICWMLVSFVQWYFIAYWLKRLMSRRRDIGELNTSV
jgi:hypothetical protein